ncbi:hypothetical protein [Bradyrhizobium erythrophlei]|uniref:Uncharacterized protein n=1 Tax=Bradyrhizobium erythrophlei TaxID=1437360 RepID=A0A1M5I7N0_9BRAD|nr:hypothetical protein [Bradyrhizobium erythrophlei]SHG24099.1 hypothetical protein SAMN05443248_0834 [Bradyrhizobium erythrophlei]
MSVLHTDEVAPQLFECFIDRAQAVLPEHFPREAKGAVVAGPDLVRGLEDYPDSYESWGWRASTDGTGFECCFVDRDCPKRHAVYLEIERRGEFWYIWRDFERGGCQALVVAFENVPICTRTFRDAIRLAEHCHPVARAPMAGFWLDLR